MIDRIINMLLCRERNNDKHVIDAHNLADTPDELQYDFIRFDENHFGFAGWWENGRSTYGDCAIIMDVASSVAFKLSGASSIYGVFTLHDWSGIMMVQVNGVCRGYIDLYSETPQRALLKLYDTRRHGEVGVELKSVGQNDRSKSSQIVFHGILLRKDESPAISFCNAAAEEEYKIDLTLRKKPKKHQLIDALSIVDAAVGKIIVLENDTRVSKEICDNGIWGRQDLAAFKRLVRPGDTVFDIGANIGHHSLFFSKAVGRKGIVLSFEPQDIIFKTLCANLLINKCSNVLPYKLGIGDQHEFLRMAPISYEAPGNFAARTIPKHDFYKNGELVEIMPLDLFMDEYRIDKVDFIKMDVQTFELFVLRGALRTLTEHSPVLYMEISPYYMKAINRYDYIEIYRLLNSLGYIIINPDDFSVLEDSSVMSSGSPDYDKDSEWNVIAYPKTRSMEALCSTRSEH